MEIQVKDQTHIIEFTFKTIKAITKSLNCPKISDLEKGLSKIGYDNAATIAAVALKANGVDVKASDIEDSIEDPGFPLTLVAAISKAVAPEGSDVAENVAEGN